MQSHIGIILINFLQLKMHAYEIFSIHSTVFILISIIAMLPIVTSLQDSNVQVKNSSG